MEPPTTVPRRATTLTRLWRSTDAADSIAQFLPTEALPVLPNIAKTFERDHWRLLGALMRRAKRGTAAACKSAVLSTLLLSRDPVHLREDWADQARYSENWEEIVYHRGGGEPERVDYTATVSPGTLALDRRTPKNSTSLASRFDIPGAGDLGARHFLAAMDACSPESANPNYTQWTNAFVRAANLLSGLPSASKPSWWNPHGLKERLGLVLANPEGHLPDGHLFSPAWKLCGHAFEMENNDLEAAKGERAAKRAHTSTHSSFHPSILILTNKHAWMQACLQYAFMRSRPARTPASHACKPAGSASWK